MELSGTIKIILETQVISASFRKRELVLTTEARYPQQILVEFTQDKIPLLDGFRPGEEVNIQIDIRGREWKSPRGDVKYFVSLHGWKISRAGEEPSQPVGGFGDASTGGPPADDTPFPESQNGGDSFRDDDIPF